MDVIADTYVGHATGATPIQINISGVLWKTKKQDHRLKFLYMFMHALRGTALDTHQLELCLVMRDTYCSIRPTFLNIVEGSTSNDTVQFTMSAVASNYRVAAAAL